MPSQTQHFPTLVSPPNDRSSLSIEHQKNILNQNTSNVNVFFSKIYLS